MNPQSPLEQPDGNNPPGTGQPIGKVPRGGRGGVGGLPGKGPGVAGLPGKDPSVGSVLGKGLGGVEGMPGKGLSGGPENRRGLTAGGIAAIGGAGAVVGGIIGTLIFPGIGTVVGAAVGSVVGGGAAVVDYTRPASADMVGHQPVEDIQDVPPDIEV